MNMDPVPTLERLRAGLTDRQRTLLSAIWDYRLAKGQWMPVRALHVQNVGGKSAVREAFKPLGGCIVLQNRESGQEVYQLTLLGVLVSSVGVSAERLLSKYLAWVRELAAHDAEIQDVTADMAGEGLQISESESKMLNELILLGNFWGRVAGGGPSWKVGLPYDIEDLPDDIPSYIAGKALIGFDTNMPFEDDARRAYLFEKTSSEGLAVRMSPAKIWEPHEDNVLALPPREHFHLSLSGPIYDLLMEQHYDTAICEAFREVEVAARHAAGLSPEDLGVGLMRQAFDKVRGALTDSTLPEAERDATAHLFAGAIGLFKNPRSYRHAPITDPAEALELLFLASHLLRIIDSRRATRSSGS